MKTIDWEEESKRFNTAADYYDIYRPSYPSDLIDCIEMNTNLQPQSKILEIGAGSGKASELFLNRGYELLCIEPGPQLAEMGMNKHKDKKVEFIVTRFEQWDEPHNYYDLVFSAQAFHWVPKPVGYEKCANTLKPDGQLALFWNMYLGGSDVIDKELISICNHYRVLPFQDRNEIEQRIHRVSAEISDCGHFQSPSIYRFPWSQQYDIENFIGFLKTGNGFLALSESDQSYLEKELIKIISKNGGYITLTFISTLFLSQKTIG